MFLRRDPLNDLLTALKPVRGQTPMALKVSPDLTDACLLYTSDAADERSSVDLGGRRIIKQKKRKKKEQIKKKKQHIQSTKF